MPFQHWNDRLDYLLATRRHLWNDDYFEFLVRQVWKLERRLDIVDFGCGYGYLGARLLPLLPAGSSYTGLDNAPALLEEGRRLFADSPYKAGFEQADLTRYTPEPKYDLAVCQAFLRHLPRPMEMLEKMVGALRPGGMVVCIEVNRRMENAGFFVGDSFDYAAHDARLQQAWAGELAQGGRNYLTGIKLPGHMRQLGLVDVDVRVNDYVEFIPAEEAAQDAPRARAFVQEKGADPATVAQGGDLLQARCLLISYGWKPE